MQKNIFKIFLSRVTQIQLPSLTAEDNLNNKAVSAGDILAGIPGSLGQ